jgi:hypothetical protein
MRRIALTLLLTVLTLATAQAEVQRSKDPAVDKTIDNLAQAQALTMLCDVPGIQPKLAVLKRSYSPTADKLIAQFLGTPDTLIGNGQPVVSPIWGKGTRYKSGTVIYALPTDNGNQNTWDLKTLPKLESVPAFLDVYSSGFLYTNNVPHKAVNMPDVKVQSGKLSANHRNLFSEKDGQAAAEALLGQMGLGLKTGEGFRIGTQQLIQNFGERLYVYRAQPEYLTSYAVYKTVNGQSQAAGTKPIAVPVLDCYTTVMLDGDKLLAGMEYFWDNNLSVSGQPKECVQAGVAVMKARGWLMKKFGNHPPLMNVNSLRLGYIQDRSNRTQLVPVWIFDAWYNNATPVTGGDNPVEVVSDPFAVNALTGDVIDL